MQEVFDKLRSLQEVLSKKFEIEREYLEIPKALTTKTELMNRLKKSYIEKNKRIDEIKERIKMLRQKLIDAENDRETYEKQMDLIKTQREYEALDKEIKGEFKNEEFVGKKLLIGDFTIKVGSYERSTVDLPQEVKDKYQRAMTVFRITIKNLTGAM